MTNRQNQTLVEFIVAFALLTAIIFIMFELLGRLAYGGERLACKTQPDDPALSWHYRTKIPGYGPGVRDDKCWYVGERMKPREELYWHAAPTAPSIMAPWEQWESERWRGAAPGWDHKE